MRRVIPISGTDLTYNLDDSSTTISNSFVSKLVNGVATVQFVLRFLNASNKQVGEAITEDTTGYSVNLINKTVTLHEIPEGATSFEIATDASVTFKQDRFDATAKRLTIDTLNSDRRRVDNNLEYLDNKIGRETEDSFVDVISSGNQYEFTRKDGEKKTVGSHPTSLRRYNYIYLANDYDVDADTANAGLANETVEVTDFDATSDTAVGNAEEVGTIVPSTLVYTGRTDVGWSQTPPELPDDPTSTTDPKAKVDSDTVTLWIQPVDIIISGTKVTFFRREAMKTSETDHGITLDELEDGDSDASLAIKAILAGEVSSAEGSAEAAAESAAAAKESADDAADSASEADADADRADAAAARVDSKVPNIDAISAAANAFAGEEVSPYHISIVKKKGLNDGTHTIPNRAKGADGEFLINWIPETLSPRAIIAGREFVTSYHGKVTISLPNIANTGNNRDMAIGVRVTHIFKAPNGTELFSFVHNKVSETKRIRTNGSTEEFLMPPLDSLSIVEVGTPYTLPDGSAATITQADLDNLNFYYKVDFVLYNMSTTSGGAASTIAFYNMSAWFYQLRDAVTWADEKSLGAIRDEVLAAEQTTATLQRLASTEADLAKAFAQGSDERLADLSQSGSSAKTYSEDAAASAEEAAEDAQEITDRLNTFAQDTGVGEQCIEPDIEISEGETVAEDEETASINLGGTNDTIRVTVGASRRSGFPDTTDDLVDAADGILTVKKNSTKLDWRFDGLFATAENTTLTVTVYPLNENGDEVDTESEAVLVQTITVGTTASSYVLSSEILPKGKYVYGFEATGSIGFTGLTANFSRVPRVPVVSEQRDGTFKFDAGEVCVTLPRGLKGNEGKQGPQGAFYLELFTKSETEPNVPTTFTYDRPSDTFTVSGGGSTWALEAPATSGEERLWTIRAPIDPRVDFADSDTIDLLTKFTINVLPYTGSHGTDGAKGNTGNTGNILTRFYHASDDLNILVNPGNYEFTAADDGNNTVTLDAVVTDSAGTIMIESVTFTKNVPSYNPETQSMFALEMELPSTGGVGGTHYRVNGAVRVGGRDGGDGVDGNHGKEARYYYAAFTADLVENITTQVTEPTILSTSGGFELSIDMSVKEFAKVPEAQTIRWSSKVPSSFTNQGNQDLWAVIVEQPAVIDPNVVTTGELTGIVRISGLVAKSTQQAIDAAVRAETAKNEADDAATRAEGFADDAEDTLQEVENAAESIGIEDQCITPVLKFRDDDLIDVNKTTVTGDLNAGANDWIATSSSNLNGAAYDVGGTSYTRIINTIGVTGTIEGITTVDNQLYFTVDNNTVTLKVTLPTNLGNITNIRLLELKDGEVIKLSGVSSAGVLTLSNIEAGNTVEFVSTTTGSNRRTDRADIIVGMSLTTGDKTLGISNITKEGEELATRNKVKQPTGGTEDDTAIKALISPATYYVDFKKPPTTRLTLIEFNKGIISFIDDGIDMTLNWTTSKVSGVDFNLHLLKYIDGALDSIEETQAVSGNTSGSFTVKGSRNVSYKLIASSTVASSVDALQVTLTADTFLGQAFAGDELCLRLFKNATEDLDKINAVQSVRDITQENPEDYITGKVLVEYESGNHYEVTEHPDFNLPIQVTGGITQLGNNRGEFWGFNETRNSGLPITGESDHNPIVNGAHSMPVMGARKPHSAVDLDGTNWPTFVDSQRGPYIERRNRRNPDNSLNTSTEVGVDALTWVVLGEGGITENRVMTGLSDQFDLIQFAGDYTSDLFDLEAFLIPNAAIVAKDDLSVTLTLGSDIAETFAIQVRNSAGTTTQNKVVNVGAGSTSLTSLDLKSGDSIRIQVSNNGGSYDITIDANNVRHRTATFTGRYTGIQDEYLEEGVEMLRFAVEEEDVRSNTDLQNLKYIIQGKKEFSVDEYIGGEAGQTYIHENPTLVAGDVPSSRIIDEVAESTGYFFDIEGRTITARKDLAGIIKFNNIEMSRTDNVDIIIAEVDGNGDVTINTDKIVDAESTANGDSYEAEIDLEAGKSYIVYILSTRVTGIGSIEIAKLGERQIFKPELDELRGFTRLLSDNDRDLGTSIEQVDSEIEGLDARLTAVETEPRLIDSNNNPILIQELDIENVLALPNPEKDYVTEWANLLEAFRPAQISDKFTTAYPSSTEAADRFSDVVAATVNSTLTPTYGKGVSDETFEANDGDSTGIKVLTPIPNLTAVIRGLKGTLDGDVDTPVDFDVTVKLLVNDTQVASQTLTINTKVGGVGNTGIAAGDVSLGALTDIEINDVIKVQITIDSAPMSQGASPAAVDATIDFGQLELSASGAQAILAPSEIPALRQPDEFKDEVWAVRDFADSSRGLSVQVYERQFYVNSDTVISDGNVFNYDDTGAIETPDVAEITIDVEAIDSSRSSKNHRIRVYKFTDGASAPTLVTGTDLDFEAAKNTAEKKGSITFESEAGAKYFLLLNNPGNRGDITGGKLTISGVFKNYPDFTNRTKYPNGYPQGFARPHNYDQVAGLYEKTASTKDSSITAIFETKTVGSTKYSGFGEGRSVGNLFPDLGRIITNMGASSIFSLHSYPDSFSTVYESIIDEQVYYDMLRDENMRKFFNAGGDIDTDATAGGAMNPKNYNPAVNDHPQLTFRISEIGNSNNHASLDLITFRHATVNGINCRRFRAETFNGDVLAKFNGKRCTVQIVNALDTSIHLNPFTHSWTGVNVHNTTLSNLIQQFSSYKTSRDAKIREIIAVINASSLSDTIGPL